MGPRPDGNRSLIAGNTVDSGLNRTFVGEPRPDVDILAFATATEDLGPVILEAALSANKAEDRKTSTEPIFRPEERLPIAGQAKPPPEGADVVVVLLERIFSDRGELSPGQRLDALVDSPLPVIAIGIEGRGEAAGPGPTGAQAKMAKKAGLTVLTRSKESDLTKPLRKALEDERPSQRIVSLPGGRVARTFIGTDPDDKEPAAGLCPASAKPRTSNA